MNTRVNIVKQLATLTTLAAALCTGGCDVEDEAFLEEMEMLEEEDELDDVEFRDFADLEVRHGKHKVKITNTTGNKWKIKWKCVEYDADGLITDLVKIDADQFPASTGTTRETDIDDRCPDGKWRVYLYVKDGGEWEPVTPSGEESVCGDGNWSCGYEHNGQMRYYIPNTHFNGSDKICLKAWWAVGSFWVDKVGC